VHALLRRPVRPLVAAVAALTLTGGSAVAAAAVGAANRPDHPRRVQAPGTAAAATAGTATAANQEFTSTANPTSLDPAPQVPPAAPVVVTIANHAAFGNGPPPAVKTVDLPSGHFSHVVLDVTGKEEGRQYDRLCEIFDGPAQIFLGVTPEPTPQGITWHVAKDITGYMPLLTGRRTFSTYVDNYLSSVDTGVPVITAKLLFYRAAGPFQAAHPASLASPSLAGLAIGESGPASAATRPGVPTGAVPLVPPGASTTLNTINTGQTLTSTVSLPSTVTTATLDLYAVGQYNDEFWWSLNPSFREIEVSIDGRPAGVVWPYPYVYTGGVNPLIWRPLTGIHTLDIPSYRLDLTPFAGKLGGTHTISLTVANNAGYWLAGGTLLLTTDRYPTTGQVTSDTLGFPTQSTVTTQDALGSSNQPVTSESAQKSYRVSGQVVVDGQTWTDTIQQKLQFGDDQSYINPSCSGPCYQWVHGEETQATTESVTGPQLALRTDRSTWTIDAPNGFLTDSTGANFFLPASVSQQLTDVAQDVDPSGSWSRDLMENIIGYGALEEDSGAPTITDGETTGTVSDHTTGPAPADNMLYQRTIVTRGGRVVDNVSG
jgi:hypothetical protein